MSRAKRNVAYIKPPEPAFLRKLKERAGYEEGPTVETKKKNLPLEPADEVDERYDERPTVVVLKKGDLTAEEAEDFLKDKDDSGHSGGRIEFRKPAKRSIEEQSNPLQSSTKKVKNDSIRLNLPERKKIKNSSLLSFVDEDE